VRPPVRHSHLEGLGCGPSEEALKVFPALDRIAGGIIRILYIEVRDAVTPGKQDRRSEESKEWYQIASHSNEDTEFQVY